MAKKQTRLAEAQSAALRLYPAWAVANGHDPHPRPNGNQITGLQAMLFFQFLQAEHPEALDFHFGGDKWQAVHGWLMDAGISSGRD
jgi:hypothetical protein